MRIGSGEDRCSGVHSCLDASFGNGDRLLLHGLVDRHLIFLIHLVKLIDTANTVVCQHQSTRLNAKLATLAVLNTHPCSKSAQKDTADVDFDDGGSQTSCTTGFARNVDGTGNE